MVPDSAYQHNATCPICHTTFLVTSTQQASTDGQDGWVDPMTVSPEFDAESETLSDMPEERTTSTPVDSPVPPEGILNPEQTSQWIRSERVKFDHYVRNQLATLKRIRLDNANAESQHESKCIQRTMELNQLGTQLEARRQEVERREAEVARNLSEMQERQDALEQRDRRITERETGIAHLEKRRAHLESEAASLASLVSELRPVVEDLELRKVENQTLIAELSAKQTALDRRYVELGRNEVAMQKRIAELQELERSLQEELEEREADLEKQRATFLEEVRALRNRYSIENTPPPTSRKSDDLADSNPAEAEPVVDSKNVTP